MQDKVTLTEKKWEKPKFLDIRLGFEITMYVNTKS
ncbi:MAG: pyrroloquinoline quinone precursor peptide PqqA [Oligoflexus sp.]